MNYLIKNLLIALVITVVLGAAYYFVFGKSTSVDEFDETEVTLTAKQQTEKILLDTQRINQFSIDDSIFSDARFISLENTRVELEEIPTGRSNPFDPVN